MTIWAPHCRRPASPFRTESGVPVYFPGGGDQALWPPLERRMLDEANEVLAALRYSVAAPDARTPRIYMLCHARWGAYRALFDQSWPLAPLQ